jgi:hypothetical protein
MVGRACASRRNDMETNDSNGSEQTIELRSSVLVMAFIDFKVMVNVDQSVPFDLAEKVANKYGFKVKRVAE